MNSIDKRLAKLRGDFAKPYLLPRVKVDTNRYEEYYHTQSIIQHGHCAICPEPFSNQRSRAQFDYSVKTGKMRGLLCESCFALLNAAKDKKELLRAAWDYLDKHGEQVGFGPNAYK